MRIIVSQRCQHECPCKHAPKSGEPMLNNPSLAQPGEEHQEESPQNEQLEGMGEELPMFPPGKVVLIKMIGDTSNVSEEEILELLKHVIMKSEESEMPVAAAKLKRAVAKLEKSAKQYKNFGVFWLAFGRAFEKSYKKKKEEKGDAPNAATEAWMETLEEYQESLLKDEGNFIAKYAGKKAVEEADMGGGGGSGSQTMSKSMTDRYKRIKKMQEELGISEGEATSKWLEEASKSEREASVILLNKISSKLEDSDPGVAFYESLEELLNMKKMAKREAIAEIGAVYADSVAQDREAFIKKAFLGGVWDRIQSPFRQMWKGLKHNVGDWFSRQKAQEGKANMLRRQIDEALPSVKSKLGELPVRLTSGTMTSDELLNILNTYKFYPNLIEYLKEVSRLGAVTPAPDPKQFSDNGLINLDKFNQFLKSLQTCLVQVNEQNANAADQKVGGTPFDDITKLEYPEDRKLKGIILLLANKMKSVISSFRTILPAGTAIPNIFDKASVLTELNRINITQSLAQSVTNIQSGADLSSEASEVSAKITGYMDQLIADFIDKTLTPILTNLRAGSAANPAMIRMQYDKITDKAEKLQDYWERSKLKMEEEIQKALETRYKRMNPHEQEQGVQVGKPTGV